MAHLPVLLDSYDKQMCITLWMLPPILTGSVLPGYADLRLATTTTRQTLVDAEAIANRPDRERVTSVIAQRKRPGISANDFGKLVGVSAVTIYAWELGRTRPRKAQVKALGLVRAFGKKQARARLGDR